MNSILSQKLASLKIFIVIILLSIHIKISVLQAQKEASALLKWKSSLDSQSQLVLKSWDRKDDLCESWTGISCSNNSLSESIVTRIRIVSSRLKGNLSYFDFASFQNLQVLELYNNSLVGPIPSNLFNASQLKHLDLSVNDFSGVIPYELGMLQYLEFLYLQSNSLTGDIPKSIGNLTNLAKLDLFQNHLSGTIPKEIGMLSRKFENLDFSSNNLTGEIPSSLGNLTQLESLDLSSNQVTGKIPPELTRLTFMVVFNVSNNQLTGTIPQGGQFNTYERNSYQGNPALCGYPLPKRCRVATSLLLSPLQEDDSTFFNGFTWQSVVLGYACGIVPGIGFGCVMLIKGKPNWVLRLVNERKLRDD